MNFRNRLFKFGVNYMLTTALKLVLIIIVVIIPARAL